MSLIRNVIGLVGSSALVLGVCGCASRADLDHAQHENIRVSDELSQTRAERDQLRQQNADLQKQLKVTETNLTEARDKMKVTEARGTDVDELRRQVNEAHQNSAEMQKKLAEAQTASAEAQKQVADLNARMTAQQAEMNQKLQADETELAHLRAAQPRSTHGATTRPTAEGAP